MAWASRTILWEHCYLIAFGAQRPQILDLTLVSGLRPALFSLIGGSAAVAKLTRSLLYGIEPYDLTVFLAVITILLAVATLACTIPAWRAPRLDPLQALRVESITAPVNRKPHNNMFRTILFLTAASLTFGQAPATPTGEWLSQRKYFDNNIFQRMRIEVTRPDAGLSGKFGNQDLSGVFRNGHLELSVKLSPNATLHLSGDLKGDRIEGVATATDSSAKYEWIATRIPPRTEPRTHTFNPTSFEHFFSDAATPVLHIGPGDTVKTWSVDSGGFDSKNERLTSGGNPLTGPFYIDGAVPGDTLVIHFIRIRLNRDTAQSSPLIINTALSAGYVELRKNVPGYDATWKLDRNAGFASLLHPTERLKDYKIPLAPMLGCVGVAPSGGNRFQTAYLGDFGGNMDYNQLREGTTVYLPVFAPGALLSVGDGHAVQGAGELAGNALETSMDIEFTVDVIPGASSGGPRMENSEYLMASGMSESLDDAFRYATTNFVQWLKKTYALNDAEVSSVVSTAVIYDIAEYVDTEDHVVARIPKSVLARVQPARKNK